MRNLSMLVNWNAIIPVNLDSNDFGTLCISLYAHIAVVNFADADNLTVCRIFLFDNNLSSSCDVSSANA